MPTPPDWAHPYATAWDDMVAPAVENMAGVPVPSGGQWRGSTVDAHLTLDPTQTYLGFEMDRGQILGGRDAVASGFKPLMDGTAGGDTTVGVQGFATIPVPVATDQGAYVRADVWEADNTTGVRLTLYQLYPVPVIAEPSGVVFQLVKQFRMERSDDDVVTVTAYPGTFDPGDVTTINDIGDGPLMAGHFGTWHNWEMRLDAGVVSGWVDGTMVLSGTYPLPLDSIWASFEVITNVAGVYALVDNFEAGPLTQPIPVPVLSVAPGPVSLHFESPRPI